MKSTTDYSDEELMLRIIGILRALDNDMMKAATVGIEHLFLQERLAEIAESETQYYELLEKSMEARNMQPLTCLQNSWKGWFSSLLEGWRAEITDFSEEGLAAYIRLALRQQDDLRQLMAKGVDLEAEAY